MMFGKKKQPLPPFILQVLTTDYLIDGTVEGDTALIFPETGVASKPLHLTSVQIRVTGPVDIPVRTCPRFTVMGNSAVALLPLLEMTQITEMARYEVWKEYKKPVQGIFYVGPYVIQGRLMLLMDNYLDHEMPMFDVNISSQVPGARWGKISAPFALVNTRWLHGYEPF
jgi:hypothetical protein